MIIAVDQTSKGSADSIISGIRQITEAESLPLSDAEAWRWLTSNATQLSFSGGRCTVTVTRNGKEFTRRHPDPKTAINLADAALRGAGL